MPRALRQGQITHSIGRPPKYDPHLANSILWQIAVGKSVRQLSSADGANETTVLLWAQQNEEFARQLARARELQAYALAAETLDIADDRSNDIDAEGRPNNAAVQRDRLRVETRFKLASKYNPATFGDKTIHTGPDGMSAIQVQHVYDASLITPEELHELRRILRKMRGATLDME